MRRISGLLMAWLVVLTVIAGSVTSVTSVTSAGASPSRPLDLAHGWGGAKACLLPPSGPVECFATESALRARSAGLRAHKAGSGCPVSLYSGAGYTGNVLEVWPQGYWLNLSDFGFDKVTVSFIGSGCGFHLAERWWGGGAWFPGYTGPWAATWDMGWWDRRTSSVYVN